MLHVVSDGVAGRVVFDLCAVLPLLVLVARRAVLEDRVAARLLEPLTRALC